MPGPGRRNASSCRLGHHHSCFLHCLYQLWSSRRIQRDRLPRHLRPYVLVQHHHRMYDLATLLWPAITERAIQSRCHGRRCGYHRFRLCRSGHCTIGVSKRAGSASSLYELGMRCVWVGDTGRVGELSCFWEEELQSSHSEGVHVKHVYIDLVTACIDTLKCYQGQYNDESVTMAMQLQVGLKCEQET